MMFGFAGHCLHKRLHHRLCLQEALVLWWVADQMFTNSFYIMILCLVVFFGPNDKYNKYSSKQLHLTIFQNMNGCSIQLLCRAWLLNTPVVSSRVVRHNCCVEQVCSTQLLCRAWLLNTTVVSSKSMRSVEQCRAILNVKAREVSSSVEQICSTHLLGRACMLDATVV